MGAYTDITDTHEENVFKFHINNKDYNITVVTKRKVKKYYVSVGALRDL